MLLQAIITQICVMHSIVHLSGVLIFAIDNKVKEASEFFLSDSFNIHIFCSKYKYHITTTGGLMYTAVPSTQNTLR